jgi:hypothetical protein
VATGSGRKQNTRPVSCKGGERNIGQYVVAISLKVVDMVRKVRTVWTEGGASRQNIGQYVVANSVTVAETVRKVRTAERRSSQGYKKSNWYGKCG